MQEPQSWRELLCNVLENEREKQRIADELGISPHILERWADGEAQPRPHNLYQLLCALPRYHQPLLELVIREFEIATHRDQGLEDAGEIASAFYDRVLKASISVPIPLRYWVVTSLVLQQAIAQLDPKRQGMAIMVVRCMPPTRGGKVHSLRGSLGIGTVPWRSDLESQAMFHGNESLAGYVVSTGRFAVIEDIFDHSVPPANLEDYSVSAIACPVVRATRVAGCLLAASTQPGYFTEGQLKLFQHYARLLTVAFESDEYYESEEIDLYEMPGYEVQTPYLSSLKRRIARIMVEANCHQFPMDISQAERLAWQQVEEELFAITSQCL